MKRVLAGFGAAVVAVALAGVSRASDDVTVIGYVSDSMCGLNHADMQAKHGGVAQFSDAACAKACVEGGGKYVLADRDGNRTYNLKDQKKIARYAGQRVQIKGDLKGDMLEIDKISAMP
jgi:uncharacterized protein DUF5818